MSIVTGFITLETHLELGISLTAKGIKRARNKAALAVEKPWGFRSLYLASNGVDTAKENHRLLSSGGCELGQMVLRRWPLGEKSSMQLEDNVEQKPFPAISA